MPSIFWILYRITASLCTYLDLQPLPQPEHCANLLQGHSNHSSHQEVPPELLEWHSKPYEVFCESGTCLHSEHNVKHIWPPASSDTLAAALRISLPLLEDKDAYIRMLFIYYNLAFNLQIHHKLLDCIPHSWIPDWQATVCQVWKQDLSHCHNSH